MTSQNERSANVSAARQSSQHIVTDPTATSPKAASTARTGASHDRRTSHRRERASGLLDFRNGSLHRRIYRNRASSLASIRRQETQKDKAMIEHFITLAWIIAPPALIGIVAFKAKLERDDG